MEIHVYHLIMWTYSRTNSYWTACIFLLYRCDRYLYEEKKSCKPFYWTEWFWFLQPHFMGWIAKMWEQKCAFLYRKFEELAAKIAFYSIGKIAIYDSISSLICVCNSNIVYVASVNLSLGSHKIDTIKYWC